MRRNGGAGRGAVLALLTLGYALNFVDRQVLVVLAPSLKAALGLTDAQLGLLYGTAFALFYALFGLVLARVADGWRRVALLAIGLGLWSLTTAGSALATGFVGLALLRTLVGVGEASAAPAAFSILQDLYPAEKRGTALAVHASGIYLGIGASLAVGGGVLAGWARLAHPPLGLAGWQAAFLIVGLPGLLLAAVIAAWVREPSRGERGGQSRPDFRIGLLGADLALLVPGLASLTLARMGVAARTVRRHLLALVALAIAVPVLAAASDRLVAPARRGLLLSAGPLAIDTAVVQWAAVAIGIHAALGWITALRLRDPATAAATLGDRRFRLLAIAGGVLSAASYGVAGFLFLYGKTYVGLGEADGVTLGLIAAGAGMAGTALGGVIADRARARHPNGRIQVAVGAVALSTILTALELVQSRPLPFFLLNAGATFTLTMWLGPAFAAAQEQVPPRARGTATAIQFLAINLIGLALGPYLAGLLSDATGSLRAATLLILLAAPAALVLFVRAARLNPAATPRC